MLLACRSRRELRAIYLGICAALRNAELRGIQGRHFSRPEVIWVSADIAKGARERWLPVLPQLEPIVAHIRERLEDDDYVLPAQRWRDPGTNRAKADKAKQPSSAQALYYLVKPVASRAGIKGNVHPHTLGHAFAHHIVRASDIRTAQALLGHATVGTTEAYLSAPALDDLVAAVAGATFNIERPFSPLAETGANPVRRRPDLNRCYTALQADGRWAFWLCRARSGLRSALSCRRNGPVRDKPGDKVPHCMDSGSPAAPLCAAHFRRAGASSGARARTCRSTRQTTASARNQGTAPKWIDFDSVGEYSGRPEERRIRE